MKGKNIVIIGIQPWDIEIGSNCKNIAMEFSKHNRVLYVNAPTDRISSLKERSNPKMKKRLGIAKGNLPEIEKIDTNLWNLYPKSIVESINWISSGWLFDRLNYMNARRFSADIKEALEQLNFNDFILFNDSSMFLGLHAKALLKPELYTYYIRDNLVKVPYWQKHGERIEPMVIKDADLVVNNSDYYVDYSSQYNPNSFMVGQGCDTSNFNDVDGQIPKAEELQKIKGPIVGYVGALTDLRLDLNLLEFIAKEKPEWNLVLVGPEDESFKNSILHQFSNVYFLGSKPEDSLASYIKGFDCCINPQKINEITIGNYPRKIDEYLSMGKQVVATKTKAMEMFESHVELASSKEEFVWMIDLALSKNDNYSLDKIEFAQSHTWERSVEEIYNKIESTLKEN